MCSEGSELPEIKKMGSRGRALSLTRVPTRGTRHQEAELSQVSEKLSLKAEVTEVKAKPKSPASFVNVNTALRQLLRYRCRFTSSP